ncbi:WecB/TagA/CpsF family glycosyltransferase [Synechococcales cyanobacterium C]|uniref:WecB/TagA/CpsF family glycosyltransferase n=1 Tax=Petrachloros mirabilis ULC683 TaxID=2781853 RepID=A0A8K1ZVS3_9CYAN|nr:WecB/TagA/CpsF family glycosyltransferase [Petrachloros mirabilis]NCJ06120.1 WecB/TagA/CpsF family glycosyltransferase [Petrachloros mirabilis ULC683]
MQSTFVPEAPRQFSILGVSVDLLPDYLQWLTQRIIQGLGTHVVTLNAEMTMQTEVDPLLAEIIEAAELVIPDGAGIVLYLRLYGEQIPRCPGIELSEALLRCAAAQPQPWSVFFFGGAPEVVSAAAEQWQQRLPKLALVGTQHGYLKSEDTPAFLETLSTRQPQIIFVGLGVPRQEYWIAQHRYLCPHALWIGVGGSFDIWAKRKTRAPKWLRNNNLEWVYRLYQEPWRWRRMLALPQFAWRALMAKFG